MASERYAVSLESNVPMRTRDGTVLYSDIYRPKGDGPFPVVLMRIPYEKEQAESATYAHPSWYAAHGYVLVIQDCRGRWRSEGEWNPFFNEASDGHDAVQWAAALPGTTGKVGMYGASYVGATQMLASTRAPSGLGCICPAITSSEYYEGWTYEGGALHLAFTENWSMFLSTDTARRAGVPEVNRRLALAAAQSHEWYQYLPLKQFPPHAASGLGKYFFDWLEHQSYDDYWQTVSIERHYPRINVPGLHIGGWYDIFLHGTLRNYAGITAQGAGAARGGQRMLIAPWFHHPWSPQTGEVNFGPTAGSRIVDETQIRFYNWILKGQDDGISQEPPVKLFVMGENVWRGEQEWPLKRAVNTPYYFHSDGFANALTGDGTLSAQAPGEEPHDVYTYDPRSPSVSRGGHSCCFESLTPQGAYDQRPVETWKDTLCYTSEPLAAPLEVTGPVSVTLWAASSALDTDWVARLVDVYPDGRAINLTEGILRARFRDGLDRPSLLERDTIYQYSINLRGTSNVFLPGHRIRVDIASSSFPHWDRNPNTGQALGDATLSDVVTATQTVFHDGGRPSHITLPVVPR
jgi:putative CocE/NonD family hydrolase